MPKPDMLKLNSSLRLGIAVIAFICILANAQAAVIYVPDNYAKIQWAVDNASAGDTIIVRPGTYIENVDIDKSVEIRSYSQNPADTIVKASNPNDHVFYVTADNVYISGFTVTGATGYKAGIYLHNSNNCMIENVNVSNNFDGIDIYNSSNNTIANNTIANNEYGIVLILYSSNNSITNNTFYLNGMLVEFYSYNNTIIDNTVNGKPLVYLENVNDYVVEDAGQVIAINSNNITVKNSNLSRASIGVEFWNTNSSEIINNTIANNLQGIYLYDSSSNTVTNTIANNLYGIFLYSSSNTIYLNNFINNTIQVYSCLSINIWNSTYPITYTYNGNTYANHLGNYWDDYTGSDNDSDGIGDAPYPIDGNADNHPLIQPWESYHPILTNPPVADFTYIISGLTVSFDASSSYDPDGYIVNYTWEFGDGNATTESDPIKTYSYSSPGCYQVNLTVTDNDGLTNQTSKCIAVGCGDVNCDGNVSMGDVIALLYHVGYGQGICSEWAANVNGDSAVNMGDVIKLLYHVGYGEELECICCMAFSLTS